MIRSFTSAVFYVCFTLAAGVCMVNITQAEDVNVGSTAPVFTSTDDTGATWNSADHVGKKYLIVYFYPADMTGGCTKQACSYRDSQKLMSDADAEVVGVSGDSVENHKIFKDVHKLNFTLLADPEGTVASKFGVASKSGGTIAREVNGKSVNLTRGVTASRWTFVIDKNGKVIYKNTSVNAEEDSHQVLAAIKKAEGK
jgi:peroxiredoxin Q/BCP